MTLSEKSRDFLKKVPGMLGYSAANITIAGGPHIIGLYFMMFLTEVEGLSLAQAGLVMLLGRIWDGVIDPVIGLMTDRTRSRFGRRRPYYLLGLLPVVVSYICMWYSFGIPNESPALKTLYYILAYFFFVTAMSIISVPHESLMPEIAPEYSLRVHYNSAKYIMNSAGMMSMFMLSAAFFGFLETKSFTPELKNSFLLMGAVLGAIFIIPLIITFYSTKEKDWREIPKPPLNAGEIIWEYRESFKSRAMRQYIVLQILNYISINVFSSANPYFLKYVSRNHAKLNLLITYQGFGQMSAFPLIYWMSLRYGKQSPAKLLTPLMPLAVIISFFITTQTDPNTAFILQTVTAMLFYFGWAGMSIMPATVFPDTTDVDELITGKRREGVLSAINTLAGQSSVGLGQGLTGLVCALFGVQTAQESLVQTDTAVWGLRVAFAVLPALLAIVFMLLSGRFKMKKSDHELITRVIAEKKEHGTVTVTDGERAILEDITGQSFEEMWIGRC